jgi:hypothetical protein
VKLKVEVRAETPALSGCGEEPCAFFLGKRRIAVLEIVDRWPALQQCYFKIVADDGATYILRHDELAGEWELTLFQAPVR